MKTKIYTIVMLLTIILAARYVTGQEIVGYSGLFTFDTRLTNLNGIINNAGTGTGVFDADITLTGQSRSYTSTSLSNGGYSIPSILVGSYNLNVFKPGFQTFNTNVIIEGEPSQVINVTLQPDNSSSLSVNSYLTVYADHIVESPPNYFTLNGSVRINNVLFFDGSIIIDKRSNLTYPEINGTCGFFAKDIENYPVYWIKNNNIQFKYYAQENNLIPLSYAYILDGSFMIGGFYVTIGELIIDKNEDYVEVKSIAKIPFPIDKVMEFIKESNPLDIPYYVEKVSSSLILSKINGLETSVEIEDISVDIGLVSIENLNLNFNTNTNTFGGGFKLNIPGKLKIPKSVSDSLNLKNEFDDLQVEIRNEDNQVKDSLSFNEFLLDYYEKGFKLLSVGAEIEFVQGAINKIIISIGTKVPIGSTGLFFTEFSGGFDDLAAKNWKILGKFDIETGVELPVLGSPIKINDFEGKIQPWDKFYGSGEFLVFDHKVSDGKLFYQPSKNSLAAEGTLNLASILIGKADFNLTGGLINGSGFMTLTTPAKLPGLLWWAQNKKLGSVFVEQNNQYIQGESNHGGINLATKLEYGKPGFPWFYFYLGTNLKNLMQIWKGTKDSKQAINLLVPENTGQLVVIAMDSINPTPFNFTLQSPTGQIFDEINADYYELNLESNQTIMSLKYPMEGEWLFLTTYEGDLALYPVTTDQKPSLIIEQPNNKLTRNNEISLTFNDYADTVIVQVYYNTNNKRFDGNLIDEFALINNATLNFSWQNENIPNGEYYIYSRVDDGKNTPLLQYAPGTILVENNPSVEPPQNLSVTQMGDSVFVSWERPSQLNSFVAIVYFKDLSTWEIEQTTVVDQTHAEISSLRPGRGYEIWCQFVDDIGTFSSKSNIINFEFLSPNRNNPPYFKMDPDSTFVFIAGETREYDLRANDVDGNPLTFSTPGDTLGIIIDDNHLFWTPNEIHKGVYRIVLVVSDGSETDTTFQQLIVYTPGQVETSIAFNSVRLFEQDNTFVILRNYFAPELTQTVTLTNMRNLQETQVDCRRINEFEYIGQFYLSVQNRSEINVANGDSIKATYLWNNEVYNTYAYYDSLPQPTDIIPPGIINDITAERLPNNQVMLKWTATGNDGDNGKAYRYDIRYAFEPIDSEDEYFTAYRILNYPYPSVASKEDSLIIELINLEAITQNSMIYFSIKAEDEMQNRGGLSNSPGVNCLINPSEITANIENTYKITLEWIGPIPNTQKYPGFQHYNIFRQINQDQIILLHSGITETTFTDNLKFFPDGNYKYAIQAVYEMGFSDTIFAPEINLHRFVNLSILCELEDTTNYSGISFQMNGLDTIYSQSFARTTNMTGLVMLSNVFTSNYSVEISKDGFKSFTDTIIISNNQNSFSFMLYDTICKQQLILPQGWSGISSYLSPATDSIEPLFQPILSDLIILQNETGMYWPAQNVNTLDTWNTHAGYQIKVANAVELSVSGSKTNNKTLQLSEGWNLIPVLSECGADVATLFEGQNLVIVKEVAGWNMYWPEFGINTLGNLIPGKAYFVLMGSVGTIEFPDCTNLTGFQNLSGLNTTLPNLTGFQNLSGLNTALPNLTGFQNLSGLNPSALTHTLAIPWGVDNGFKQSDIIAVIDESGNCFGAVRWQSQTTAITIFGNDPTTPGKDGFDEHDPLFFKLIRGENEYLLEVEFESSMPQPYKEFVTNGLSSVRSINIQETGILPTGFERLIKIIPNPAKDEFKLVLPQEDFGKCSLKIYCSDGQLVNNIKVFRKESNVSINNLSPGVFVLKIEMDDAVIMKRLVKN